MRKYGDVLKYPEGQDPDDEYRVMWLYGKPKYGVVVVLKAPDTDDIWTTGKIVTCGKDEFVPAPD